MDLWIRSQKKDKLFKINGVDVTKKNDNSYEITGYTTYDIFLGKYKTKERALEILNQIQERIINLQLVQLEERGKARKDVYITPYLECVYKMPEE